MIDLSWNNDGDRFEIIRSHSKGGLGQISVAWDNHVGREVAFKELLIECADRPTSRERFIREAELTGRLEHPGIVPIYATGLYGDGRPFYAMRLITGDNLQSAIDAYHSSPHRESELRRLLRHLVDVCNAVEYAHSCQVIHRDLKPDNIMLGKFGETFIVDWGLAKELGQRDVEDSGVEASRIPSDPIWTRDDTTIGTPKYLSPEQARGEDHTPATDVFSIGSTLYCVLTGRPPFAGSDLATVIEAAKDCDFPSPRSISSSVPKRLEAICLKAMSADPADRYESVAQLGRELESYIADEPIIAYPDSLVAKSARWVRKHRLATAAMTIGSVAVALISLFSTLRVNRVLRESYFSEAVAIQAARQPGYGTRIYELMDKVGSHAPQLDGLAVRNLMVSTLTDFVANEPLFIEAERPTCVATTNTEVAMGFVDGSLSVHDIVNGEHKGGITFPGASVIKTIHFGKGGDKMQIVTWYGKVFECKRVGTKWQVPKLVSELQLPSKMSWGNTGMLAAEFILEDRIVGIVSGDEVIVWSTQGEIVAHFDKRDLPEASSLKEANLKGVATSGGSSIIANYYSPQYDLSGFVVWPVDGISEDGFSVPVNRSGTYSTGIDAKDGLFAYGCDETSIYQISDGSQLNPVSRYRHHVVKSLALSADGGMLASLGEDASVILHDVRDNKVIANLRHEIFGGRNAMQFSPDQRHLIATNRHGVRVWRLYMPYITSLKGHDGNVTALAWDPEGDYLISGGYDSSFVVWTSSGNRVAEHRLGGAVSSIAFVPNSNFVLTVDKGDSCKVWNSETWAQAGTIDCPKVQSLSANADGSLVALCGDRVSVFESPNEGCEFRLVWQDDVSELARGISFDPTGQHLLVGFETGELMQYSATGQAFGKVATMVPGWPPSIVRTRSANWFIETDGDGDGVVKRWTAEGLSSAMKTKHTHTMSMSPNEKYCAYTEQGGTTVSIWGLEQNELLFQLQSEGVSTVKSMAWNPQSEKLAIGRSGGELTICSIGDLVNELAKNELTTPSE